MSLGQTKEIDKMSCCSDKMEPIKADSCCTPRDTAQQASITMRKTGCGCSPVVEDKESRKVVGVVTERDVCHKVAADDRQASEVRVEEIMLSTSACCGKDESLEDARRKLNEHKATSLPVVDSVGDCCGTISTHNLNH
jgi:CBS domain-containing protein